MKMTEVVDLIEAVIPGRCQVVGPRL